MNFAPLTDKELNFVDTILMKYGNDHSILDTSELDGFLTAIVSGPQVIPPSRWLPTLWGGAGCEPEWESDQEMELFMQLLIRQMNNNALTLMQSPEGLAPLFHCREFEGEEVWVAEEWCFGYMRGVDLGQWPSLPADANRSLDAIALHGREDNFPVLEKLTASEHQQSIDAIAPAAHQLHAYWLAQRTPSPSPALPSRSETKVGRNDPCPCGSGKKYKKCCLH